MLSDLRITQRGGKVSTSSEKQSLKRRGEEVLRKRCCAVQNRRCQPPLQISEGDHQLCTTSSSTPLLSPARLLRAPARNPAPAPDFRWRRHGSQSSSRCRPTRPPSANSCRLSPFSFPFAFFLGSFLVLLINRLALVIGAHQPLGSGQDAQRDVQGRGSARQQGRPPHRLAE